MLDYVPIVMVVVRSSTPSTRSLEHFYRIGHWSMWRRAEHPPTLVRWRFYFKCISWRDIKYGEKSDGDNVSVKVFIYDPELSIYAYNKYMYYYYNTYTLNWSSGGKSSLMHQCCGDVCQCDLTPGWKSIAPVLRTFPQSAYLRLKRANGWHKMFIYDADHIGVTPPSAFNS